jgi:hypothetical protein
MKLCEMCQEVRIETPATTRRWIEKAFGTVDDRWVDLCDECAAHCDEYEARQKTEYNFGRAYAEWLKSEGMEGAEPVDVDEMCRGSVDIPEGDYRAMISEGIESPDPRRYWEGFNSAFED